MHKPLLVMTKHCEISEKDLSLNVRRDKILFFWLDVSVVILTS